MSGQQVGTVVGGVIGAVVGFYAGGNVALGWQIGAAAGGAIGGYVDPDVIKGPKLTDPQKQTSAEGVPRPIVYGTAAVFGNVIQCQSVPTQHKHKKRTGKGGGPVQETYTYTRTAAIRICEAAPLGGTMMLRRVWMNGKLAMDRTGTGDIDAESAKLLGEITFYPGSETQLPDPDLEALPTVDGGGVGNVPAYRGTCYVVLRNVDVTNGGALPQFMWEVTSDATETAIDVSDVYAVTDYSRFDSYDTPLADNPEGEYEYLFQLSGFGTFSTDSLAAGLAWADANDGLTESPSVYVGCIVGSAGPWSASATAMIGHGATADLGDYRDLWMCYQWHVPDVYDDDVWLNGGINNFIHYTGVDGLWRCDSRGYLYRFTSGSTMDIILPLAVDTSCIRLAPDGSEGLTPIPDAPGFGVDANNNTVPIYDYGTTPVLGSFLALARESVSSLQYVTRETGPVILATDPSNTQAFWEAAYASAVAEGTVPAGRTYQANGSGGDSTFPHSIPEAYQAEGSDLPATITPNPVYLGDIVADLCDRSSVSDYDVTAVASIEVRGFPITAPVDAAGCIQALQQVYPFSFPEWGNSGDTGTKLRAVLLGGPAVVTITDDDLLETDDEETVRRQQVEFPRKVTLFAPDPDASYEATPQSAERESENVKATGEVSISTAVVLSRGEKARVVDIAHKVLWEETNGTAKFELPEEFTRIVPSDPVIYDGRRYRVQRVELGDGMVTVEGVRDRASAYTSNATANDTVALPPTQSGLRGPTMMHAMNLPSLRTSDTVPGMYVGVCGRLPGWVGCDLYLSVDGGASEQLVATIIDPATMGVLTAQVTDTGEPISIRLWNDDELDSVTAAQIAARMNAAAITSADVSEVLQFQTPTDTGNRTYDLTDLSRGLLGTDAAAHSSGDPIVILDGSEVFLPIDISHAGKTLIFRPVSRGTVPENNATYEFVYNPVFTSVTVSAITVGGENLTVSGQPIYTVAHNA